MLLFAFFILIQVTSVAQEGLLLHYTFDKGTGSDVVDAGGNDNPAMCYNMDDAAWVEGVSGMALTFDGVDDYVQTAQALTDPLEEDFTAAFWFTAEPGINARILCFNMEAERLINIRINTELVGIDDKGGVAAESTIYGETIVTDGEWHHFAMVREADLMVLYLDGEWMVDAPLAEVVTMDNLTIGARNNSDGTISHYLTGKVDEFKLYLRALSEVEIFAPAMETAVSRKSSTSAIVPAYELSELSQPVQSRNLHKVYLVRTGICPINDSQS